MLDPFDDTQVASSGFGDSQVDPFETTQNPAAEKDPGYFGDIWRGLKRGAAVTMPKQVGQAAQFFGMDSIGEKIVNWAQSNENAGNVESATGRGNDSPFSVRGNVYEAAESAVPSLAPGAAGAGVGAVIGSAVPGLGTALGALIGYGVGSLASLPIFYGSQGQDTYEKVKKAQLEAGAAPEVAESEARKAGHLSGGIEAGGELVSDVIPFGALAKPFTKASGKVVGNIVKETFFPGLKQGAKTLAKIEAGEVGTEMAQQAGESAVEGSYGAGPGATLEETSRVIMPTALMSLIPGGAGAIAHHMKLASDARTLADPAADPDQRAKIALGAASVMQEASPETARVFAKYAAQQINAGAPIEFGPDAVYHERAKDPVAEIAKATTIDEAIATAEAAVDAPLPGGMLPTGAVDELDLPGFDFQSTFPQSLPESGIAPEQIGDAHREIASTLTGALNRNESETYAHVLDTYAQAFGPEAALQLDQAARTGRLPIAAPPVQTEIPDARAVDNAPVPVAAPVPAQAEVAHPFDESQGRPIAPAAPAPTPAPPGVAPAAQAVEDFTTRKGEVKIFQSEKGAQTYLKQRSNRVPGNFTPRKTEEGWLLSRPVRQRSEAQKANDMRLARERARINPERDSLATAIGKLGGIQADELLRDGIDKQTLKDFRSGVVGKPAYRTKGGLSLDGLAEILDQYGFDVRDRDGSIDATKLRELIQEELDGTPVFTPQGHEYRAALADEQRALEDAQRVKNDFNEDELAIAGYDDLSEAGRAFVDQAFEEEQDARIADTWDPERKALSDADAERLFAEWANAPAEAEGAATGRAGEVAERGEAPARAKESPPAKSLEPRPAPTETPAKAGVSLSSIPPGMLHRITVPVEQLHDGEGVKTVQVQADEALADNQAEISAYEKLLTCVRAA